MICPIACSFGGLGFRVLHASVTGGGHPLVFQPFLGFLNGKLDVFKLDVALRDVRQTLGLPKGIPVLKPPSGQQKTMHFQGSCGLFSKLWAKLCYRFYCGT